MMMLDFFWVKEEYVKLNGERRELLESASATEAPDTIGHPDVILEDCYGDAVAPGHTVSPVSAPRHSLHSHNHRHFTNTQSNKN